MGNRRRDFRPDQQCEMIWMRIMQGHSDTKGTYKSEHNRRQRQYNRKLIAREIRDEDRPQ